jgi:hypothetical protein
MTVSADGRISKNTYLWLRKMTTGPRQGQAAQHQAVLPPARRPSFSPVPQSGPAVVGVERKRPYSSRQ